MFFHFWKYGIKNIIPNTYFSLWIYLYLKHVFLQCWTTVFTSFWIWIFKHHHPERFTRDSNRRPWVGDGLKVILAVHFAITTLEHLNIHCSYSLATRYFTAWPINLSKLGYMNTNDIVKCLIYPSRSLKIPDKERQIFTLFASILINNI